MHWVLYTVRILKSPWALLLRMPLIYQGQGHVQILQAPILGLISHSLQFCPIHCNNMLVNQTLGKILSFPQVLELWPAHSLSHYTTSTVPSEKRLASVENILQPTVQTCCSHSSHIPATWFFLDLSTPLDKRKAFSTWSFRHLQISWTEPSAYCNGLLLPFYNNPFKYSFSLSKSIFFLIWQLF